MTGPMRLAPAGMLLAAALALVALTLPLDLTVGAGAVPLGQTPASSLRSVSVPEVPVGKMAVVRLRNSALRLPGEPGTPEELSSLDGVASPSWLRAHTVASRETLSEISRATGVSVAALTTTGRLSESVALVGPGQVLVQRATDAAGKSFPAALRAHTVAQGESLWGISQQAGVSVATVVAANNLADAHAALRPGQVLMIPPPEVALVPDMAPNSDLTALGSGLSSVTWSEFASSRTHTVAPGESLWAISQETGVSMGALMAANNLSEGAVLHSGQLLMIPAPDTIPAPTVRTPNTQGPSRGASPALGGGEHAAGSKSAPRTYTVAYGDTLWDISKDVGVSLGEILAVNQISETDAIHPGDILILPRSARDPALSSSRVSEQLSTLTSMDGVTMIWPAAGRITSGFGPRIHPIFGGREFHTGVDIGTRLGHDVRVALGGIVRYVGWMGGYGKIIIVDHGNGLETAYAHLSVWVVSRGQRVEQGQKIGEVGRTGWSTGPHLLFEIRKNGRPVNPMDYLHP